MYEKDIITRNERIDNVESWYWYSEDNGAWDGPKDDWISSHSRYYFTHVRNFDTIVQAGGCLGMYPRLLSDIFQRVYTFEPDPRNFYCLNLNCQKSNIVKFNCALGMESKQVSIDRPSPHNLGMNKIREDSSDRIPMLKLDDIPLDACDMICLDVETYEANVLLGAMETISRFKPVISCENGNDTILSMLEPLGYESIVRSMADTVYAIRK